MPTYHCLTVEVPRRSQKRFGAFLLMITICSAFNLIARAQDPKPWNRLYVANMDSHTVSVVDLDVLKVQATIPVGFGPRGLAVTPDQEHVYVANFWSGTVSVISTGSNEVETTIPLPSWYGRAAPMGFAMSPDGLTLYVGNLADGLVRVISTTTNTVTATITEGYDWAMRYIALSPNGEHLYVAGAGDGKLAVIRTSDYKQVARVTNLPGARHIAVSPDGSRVYITSDSLNRVYVVDAVKYELIKTIQFPPNAGTVTLDISPTGKFAIVSNFLEKVSLIDTDPASPTYHQVIGQVQPNSYYQYCVALGADGRFAYLSNQADRGLSPNSINVIDIAPDSLTRNTIVSSIPVGLKPWGVLPVKQRELEPNPANQ